MRAASLAPLVLLLAGCGGPHHLARVSGRVTLNGQPLPKAAVVFQPIGAANADPGPGSGGFTDADGRYSLTLTGKTTPGAVVGKHKVRITLVPDDNSADDTPKRTKRLPPKYNRETTLEFDVRPGGTDKADFDLKEP